MHTLTVGNASISTPLVERAFPNVTRLELDIEEYYMDRNDDGALMQRNRAHRCTKWVHMEHISGNTVALAGLGLTGCRVDDLVITGYPEGNHDTQIIHDALQTLRPTSLNLQIRLSDEHYALIQELPRLIPNLAELHLRIALDWRQNAEDTSVASNAAIGLLVSAP